MFNRLSFSALAMFATVGTAALAPTDAVAAGWNQLAAVNRDDAYIFTYRGYHVDLSKIAGRQNFTEIADALRRQLDNVESVGLKPRLLEFFRTVPISVYEGACGNFQTSKACYTERGVTTLPFVLDPQKPIILHEMLHAYHNRMMPQGMQNPDILFHYNRARNDQLYPAGEYLLSNHKEFFAMTASVFLFGKIAREPFTRTNLKQKQPRYFEYLVRLFGVDPDNASSASPIALGGQPAATAPSLARPSTGTYDSNRNSSQPQTNNRQPLAGNCLDKKYLEDGSVKFFDRCTGEEAAFQKDGQPQAPQTNRYQSQRSN